MSPTRSTTEEPQTEPGPTPVPAPTDPDAPPPEEPEPVPADPDVADVEAGSGEGEVGPVVLPGYWVQLGKSDKYDDRFIGHLAVVLESPWAPAPIGVPDQPIAGYTYDDTKPYTVQTRDDANAILLVEDDDLLGTGQWRQELQMHG